MMRFDTPICGAAKPTPGALYMVSIMSWTSWTSSPLMLATGSEGLSSTSEPHKTIGRIIRLHYRMQARGKKPQEDKEHQNLTDSQFVRSPRCRYPSCIVDGGLTMIDDHANIR